MNRKQQTTGHRPAVKSTVAFAATAATFTIAFVAPLGAQAAWDYTNTHEVMSDGITYNVVLDVAGSRASIGTNLVAAALAGWSGAQELVRATQEDVSGTLTIPDSLTINGNEYAVTTVGSRGFWNYTGLTGVTFPANLTTLYQRAFLDSASLRAIWFKGPKTVSNGTQGYTTIAANNNSVGQMMFSGCSALKHVLVGPNVKRQTGPYRILFCYQSDCTFFLPHSDGNETWSNFATENWNASLRTAGTNPTVIYYGEGQELDIEGADGTGNGKLTFTPNTAHALTNVLAAASVFKTQFGLDSKVVITNAIEAVEGTITSELLANVDFAVKTQAQLDMVLDAVPVATPLSIDPTGATESLTVITENRKIYVLLPTNGTYKLTKGGLMIIVK